MKKNKRQYKNWEDLKHDKVQQYIYKENIDFLANLYKDMDNCPKNYTL